MRASERIIESLSEASEVRRPDPADVLPWPKVLGDGDWYASPELISIHGTPAWDRLSEADRRKLSFLEAAHFFSLNIHGEKTLIEGVEARIGGGSPVLDRYLRHLLAEEIEHTAVFRRFCLDYAETISPDRRVAFPRETAEGEEEFLFYAQVLVFEELVDAFDRRIAADTRVAPIARAIHGYHHGDEKRHLAFGRAVVRDLFTRSRERWSADELDRVRTRLVDFLRATWRSTYEPLVYEAAGLEDPYALVAEVREHPANRERRRELSAGCLDFLLREEILTEEVQP